jgi:hypothetical protein
MYKLLGEFVALHSFAYVYVCLGFLQRKFGSVLRATKIIGHVQYINVKYFK